MVSKLLTVDTSKVLVDKIFDAPKDTAKDALSQLQKYRYMIPDDCAAIIYNKIEALSDTQKEIHQLTILRLIRLTQFCKVSPAHFELIEDLVFRGLESSNGNVRENSRKILEGLMHYNESWSKLSRLEQNKEHESYIIRVEELIAKYRPNKMPVQLDGLVPSVFKTLALSWHDMMIRYEPNDNKYWKRADAVGVPEYSIESFDMDYDNSFGGEHVVLPVCEYLEMQPFLSKPIPSIKLKYFTAPDEAERKELAQNSDTICAECGKPVAVLGAMNQFTKRTICDICAIADYKVREGFNTIKAAEAHRRRLFDISYLLTEMLIDRFLEIYNLSSEECLSDAQRQDISQLSMQLQNMINREAKIALQNQPDQSEIEEFYSSFLYEMRIFNSRA